MPSYAYKYTSVSARLVVNSIEYDIVSLSTQFAINTIPIATAVLAIGYNATDGTEGPGLKLAAASTNRFAAQLYVTLNGAETKVFEGYVSGISTERTGASLGIRVSLVHWADNIRATSALTDDRTPSAYWDLDFPVTKIGSDGKAVYGLRQTMAQQASITTSNFGKMLSDIAIGFADGSQLGKGAAKHIIDNDEILASFTKMSTRLRFRFEAGKILTIASGIAALLESAFATVFQGGNMWNSFMRLVEPFLFVIVPSVDSLAFYPSTPVLKTATINLTDDDYVYITNTSIVKRLIRAMILYDRRSPESDPSIVHKKAVSVFYIDTEAKKGLIDAAQMPPWLADVAKLTSSGGTYVDISGIRSRNSKYRFTDEEAWKGSNAVANEEAADRNNIGVGMAQHILVDRVFGENRATISMPLRSDIGPGTNISLSGATFGYVTAVGIEVDGERASASSTVQLSHTRSAGDNKLYGLEQSPLYTGALATFDWATGARTII